MELYLIRHGETDFNVRGIVQGGGIDSDLNETGRKQALAFFEHYKNLDFDAVYASTLKRTHQTLAPWLEQKGYAMTQSHALVEFGWGILEGISPNPEQKKEFNQLREDWKKGFLDRGVEGGESPLQCWARLSPFIEEIKDKHAGQRILICSHGRTSRLFLSQILGQGMEKMEEFPHTNTGLNVLEFLDDGNVLAKKLNDTSHL